jgi:hypothetical protein
MTYPEGAGGSGVTGGKVVPSGCRCDVLLLSKGASSFWVCPSLGHANGLVGATPLLGRAIDEARFRGSATCVADPLGTAVMATNGLMLVTVPL